MVIAVQSAACKGAGPGWATATAAGPPSSAAAQATAAKLRKRAWLDMSSPPENAQISPRFGRRLGAPQPRGGNVHPGPQEFMRDSEEFTRCSSQAVERACVGRDELVPMVTSVILPQPVPGAAAIIWAHRGASADAPENTLAAFALAQDQQADGIELDTYRSADGDVVVIHGQTLDRTFPGATGEVTSCTTAQLEALGVPTLAQVLEATTIPINVELKDTSVRDQGLPAAAATQVLRSGASDRVVFSSFNPVGLLGVREVLPEAELAVLLPEQGLSVLPQAVEMFGGKPTEDPYAWLVDNAIPTVHLHRDSIDRATVSACAERGLHVRAWTVDDPERAAELVGLGVRDLITNRPAMIRQALAAR
ncbi:hypothetical protein CGZ91_08295 [Parenemella sanctibonifatiensis]|uniref:GP-PDE domain-containing protein n=2 Tax=Parenemella sanctibonifatiensis TaxID=2016505 RepID=A0A255ELN1_9ACTN|nr:hypothetical protein CGZ91_08295 [Parenemella sanctibonifatiensis]